MDCAALQAIAAAVQIAPQLQGFVGALQQKGPAGAAPSNNLRGGAAGDAIMNECSEPAASTRSERVPPAPVSALQRLLWPTVDTSCCTRTPFMQHCCSSSVERYPA